MSGLPEDAQAAFAKFKETIDADRYAAPALGAVRRILINSELLELWEDDTGLLEEWKAEVNGLTARLA